MYLAREELSFKKFLLGGGKSAFVPLDINLALPEFSSGGIFSLHYLIYIPWSDTYLDLIDPTYKDFFVYVLLHLHKRTTGVHVAVCFPYIQKLIDAIGKPVDKEVISLAFILHDVGWSGMTDEEISASLGVKGVTLTKEASNPKEKHVLLGARIAVGLLSDFGYTKRLNEKQKALILDSVLFHDKPWELAKNGDIPLEVQIVCDVDHLWSFTHENFWQDTVRKGVDPKEYWENLNNDLDDYFTTDEGRKIARSLLNDRFEEVKAWVVMNAGHG